MGKKRRPALNLKKRAYQWPVLKNGSTDKEGRRDRKSRFSQRLSPDMATVGVWKRKTGPVAAARQLQLDADKVEKDTSRDERVSPLIPTVAEETEALEILREESGMDGDGGVANSSEVNTTIEGEQAQRVVVKMENPTIDAVSITLPDNLPIRLTVTVELPDGRGQTTIDCDSSCDHPKQGEWQVTQREDQVQVAVPTGLALPACHSDPEGPQLPSTVESSQDDQSRPTDSAYEELEQEPTVASNTEEGHCASLEYEAVESTKYDPNAMGEEKCHGPDEEGLVSAVEVSPESDRTDHVEGVESTEEDYYNNTSSLAESEFQGDSQQQPSHSEIIVVPIYNVSSYSESSESFVTEAEVVDSAIEPTCTTAEATVTEETEERPSRLFAWNVPIFIPNEITDSVTASDIEEKPSVGCSYDPMVGCNEHSPDCKQPLPTCPIAEDESPERESQPSEQVSISFDSSKELGVLGPENDAKPCPRETFQGPPGLTLDFTGQNECSSVPESVLEEDECGQEQDNPSGCNPTAQQCERQKAAGENDVVRVGSEMQPQAEPKRKKSAKEISHQNRMNALKGRHLKTYSEEHRCILYGEKMFVARREDLRRNSVAAIPLWRISRTARMLRKFVPVEIDGRNCHIATNSFRPIFPKEDDFVISYQPVLVHMVLETEKAELCVCFDIPGSKPLLGYFPAEEKQYSEFYKFLCDMIKFALGKGPSSSKKDRLTMQFVDVRADELYHGNLGKLFPRDLRSALKKYVSVAKSDKVAEGALCDGCRRNKCSQPAKFMVELSGPTYESDFSISSPCESQDPIVWPQPYCSSCMSALEALHKLLHYKFNLFTTYRFELSRLYDRLRRGQKYEEAKLASFLADDSIHNRELFYEFLTIYYTAKEAERKILVERDNENNNGVHTSSISHPDRASKSTGKASRRKSQVQNEDHDLSLKAAGPPLRPSALRRRDKKDSLKETQREPGMGKNLAMNEEEERTEKLEAPHSQASELRGAQEEIEAATAASNKPLNRSSARRRSSLSKKRSSSSNTVCAVMTTTACDQSTDKTDAPMDSPKTSSAQVCDGHSTVSPKERTGIVQKNHSNADTLNLCPSATRTSSRPRKKKEIFSPTRDSRKSYRSDISTAARNLISAASTTDMSARKESKDHLELVASSTSSEPHELPLDEYTNNCNVIATATGAISEDVNAGNDDDPSPPPGCLKCSIPLELLPPFQVEEILHKKCARMD